MFTYCQMASGTQSDITLQTKVIKGTLRKHSQTTSSPRFIVHGKVQRQAVLGANGTFSCGFTLGLSTKCFTRDTWRSSTSCSSWYGRGLYQETCTPANPYTRKTVSQFLRLDNTCLCLRLQLPLTQEITEGITGISDGESADFCLLGTLTVASCAVALTAE